MNIHETKVDPFDKYILQRYEFDSPCRLEEFIDRHT